MTASYAKGSRTVVQRQSACPACAGPWAPSPRAVTAVATRDCPEWVRERDKDPRREEEASELCAAFQGLTGLSGDGVVRGRTRERHKPRTKSFTLVTLVTL